MPSSLAPGVFDPERGLIPDGASTAPGASLASFDGFLDNELDLRRTLALPNGDRGDLLLACWRRWGGAFPSRLRGDFALAIWDGDRGEGLIARDQLGVRPLFVRFDGPRLWFAGEMRDLLAILPTTPAPDPIGVVDWIGLRNRADSGTLYQGIERLLPGEAISLGRQGPRRWRYWSASFTEPLRSDLGETAALVREELSASVDRRLGQPGTTGVTMSGGLDSSSIAALTGPRAIACSAFFPEHEAADERDLIDELRSGLGLESLVVEARPGGLLSTAIAYAEAWKLPQSGWGDFWQLPLLRLARDHGITTILGGDGGDEIFAPRVQVVADELRSGHGLRALALTRSLPGAGPHVGRRRELAMMRRIGVWPALPAVPRAARRLGLGSSAAPDWLRPRSRRILDAGSDPDAWKRLAGPRWWAHAAYRVTREIEAAGLFEHIRRSAAVADLTPRHPMLDLDVVELCLRQPPEMTLDRRFARPVLREAMAGLLPDSIRLRSAKAHFESLIVSCLTGPDGAPIRSLLTDPSAAIGEYVDQERMAATLFDSSTMRDTETFRWMWQVWRLLNIELWLRSQDGSIPLLEPKTHLEPSRVEVLTR